MPYAYLTDSNLVFDAWAICSMKSGEDMLGSTTPSYGGIKCVKNDGKGEWIEEDLYGEDIEQTYEEEEHNNNEDEWEFVEE